ncbi:LON peptidase substrate-binding domain-containing protein [Shimia thalassica]|uniref:LON peptidase substrate-binding domain-containing protein n=1 Tax=Shimia thalassica TaxID=1715693 RepID=UPI002494900A|nr:LON peptidase substrate-binding domain-containing protein [Shimia thalassica]
MFNPADLPDTLAVFPLPGALLLPRSRLPLHIFEPRYLAMLDDALKTPGRLIGMVQPNKVPGRDGTGLQMIGCAGRVTQFSETEDHRYLITLTGISRFRIVKEMDGFQSYRRCEVNWDGFAHDLGPEEQDREFNREAFMDLLSRYFSSRDLSTDWQTLQDADDELLINSLSMLLEFPYEDKQALLEAPSLATRRETLITLIEFALRGGAGEDLLQ